MKMLIQIALVALLTGGLSAAGSIYWQQRLASMAPPAIEKTEAPVTDEKPDDKPDGAEGPDEASHSGSAATSDLAPAANDITPSVTESMPELVAVDPPIAVRPPYHPDADEAGALINRLRARAAETSGQERRMFERQDALKLIFDDLRVEQDNSSRMRQRILEEFNRSVRAVDDARHATESERLTIYRDQNESRRIADEQLQQLRREKEEAVQAAENALKSARTEQEELRKQLEASTRPKMVTDRSGTPEENTNLKKMAVVLDGMPPENTAKVLQQLVKSQRTEAVVVLLNAMKPRLSGKVLSAIAETDPVLAADLTERLKRLNGGAETPTDTTK